MQNLLNTRWKDRDVELGKRFLHVTGEINGRDILRSTVTVQAMYKVACDEFVGSRQTIVSTIMDSLIAGIVKPNKDELVSFALSSLEDRRRAIDGLFRARADVSGMLDSGMLKGHIDLASKMDGAVNELKVELIRALDEHQRRDEGNLKDKILHKLLNFPAIALLVIAVVVVAALVSLISDILSIWGQSKIN